MKKAIIILIGLVALFFLLPLVIDPIINPEHEVTETEPDVVVVEYLDEIEAYAISQLLIEPYLASPSTATYGPSPVAFGMLTEDMYYVSAYVDSQNRFGGTVRTLYEVSFVMEDGDAIMHQLAFDGVAATK
jgi:hypothetical protein